MWKGIEPGRTRTCDPLVKAQLLYRLSYRPVLQRAREGVLSVNLSGILPNVNDMKLNLGSNGNQDS